ncbi:hypothetical protein SODALDRAFT_379247 [Sodiomyces alkalinus F11]|uniref:Uncharacterized protein n=1 Tax=Sodiomyces alkalinus (strain CBS 110278 / VKM F-3762 / F11) TaxID=1314773 RepID=A0A3N2PU77_SODAK|nr:hypothetical protein SODALDRAFT_379247 [Sodiomyces alkalinus F11]ROT38014.1 hypothetical protein SODALDRAFT_379247 [Sodiomyces alkalinus F11]
MERIKSPENQVNFRTLGMGYQAVVVSTCPAPLLQSPNFGHHISNHSNTSSAHRNLQPPRAAMVTPPTQNPVPQGIKTPHPHLQHCIVTFPRNHVVQVTINRPRYMNCLPDAASTELSYFWKWYDAEPESALCRFHRRRQRGLLRRNGPEGACRPGQERGCRIRVPRGSVRGHEQPDGEEADCRRL